MARQSSQLLTAEPIDGRALLITLATVDAPGSAVTCCACVLFATRPSIVTQNIANIFILICVSVVCVHVYFRRKVVEQLISR